jgi:hypothetical protein
MEKIEVVCYNNNVEKESKIFNETEIKSAIKYGNEWVMNNCINKSDKPDGIYYRMKMVK